MNDSSWHCETLSRAKLHGSFIQADDKPTLNDVEEFVLIVMFVPVKLAVTSTKPHHAIIHLTQGLTDPAFLPFLLQSMGIDYLQRIKRYFGIVRMH